MSESVADKSIASDIILPHFSPRRKFPVLLTPRFRPWSPCLGLRFRLLRDLVKLMMSSNPGECPCKPALHGKGVGIDHYRCDCCFELPLPYLIIPLPPLNKTSGTPFVGFPCDEGFCDEESPLSLVLRARFEATSFAYMV